MLLDVSKICLILQNVTRCFKNLFDSINMCIRYFEKLFDFIKCLFDILSDSRQIDLFTDSDAIFECIMGYPWHMKSKQT